MIIEKVVSPENISNKEPYGTHWIANLESGKKVWVQCSKNEENPKWVRLGDLSESLYIRHGSSWGGIDLHGKALDDYLDENLK